MGSSVVLSVGLGAAVLTGEADPPDHKRKPGPDTDPPAHHKTTHGAHSPPPAPLIYDQNPRHSLFFERAIVPSTTAIRQDRSARFYEVPLCRRVPLIRHTQGDLTVTRTRAEKVSSKRRQMSEFP